MPDVAGEAGVFTGLPMLDLADCDKDGPESRSKTRISESVPRRPTLQVQYRSKSTNLKCWYAVQHLVAKFIRRLFQILGVLTGCLVLLAFIVIFLPAAALGMLIEALASFAVYLGANEEKVHYFIWGGADPLHLTEACNRHTIFVSEMIRGANFWTNFLYYVRNTHPVLSIGCADQGHPFSPFERIGMLLFLCSLTYATVVHSDLIMPEGWRHWEVSLGASVVPLGHWIFSACFLSVPNFVLTRILTELALADYEMNLRRTQYFEARTKVRLLSFLRRLMADEEAFERSKEDDEGPIECCTICSERVMLLYEKFATLFGYSTWIVSVAFVVGSMQRDLDGMTLRGELLRIVMSIFVFWFPLAFMSFFLQWHLEHAFGRYSDEHSGTREFLGSQLQLAYM
jgi:hypothetical protein